MLLSERPLRPFVHGVILLAYVNLSDLIDLKHLKSPIPRLSLPLMMKNDRLQIVLLFNSSRKQSCPGSVVTLNLME